MHMHANEVLHGSKKSHETKSMWDKQELICTWGKIWATGCCQTRFITKTNQELQPFEAKTTKTMKKRPNRAVAK